MHSQTHSDGELRGQIAFPEKVDVFPSCSANDCCDTNDNAVRDSVCVYCKCDAEQICTTQTTVFGDVGGSFGVCQPEGFVNIHDRNQVVTCFAGSNQCPSINVDLGGAFANCNPDGFCNVHDANHTLIIFAGNGTCSCGPQPETPPTAPALAGRTRLLAVPERQRIAP